MVANSGLQSTCSLPGAHLRILQGLLYQIPKEGYVRQLLSLLPFYR